MSYGIVICSICKREVHQDGERHGFGKGSWTHCQDKTARCIGSASVYPSSDDEIAGRFCGADRGGAT